MKSYVYYYTNGEAEWGFDIPKGSVYFFDKGYFALRCDDVPYVDGCPGGFMTAFYNPTPETIALFNSPKAYISNYDIKVMRDTSWIADYRQYKDGWVAVAMEVQNVGDSAGYILREIIRKDTGERLQWEYKWMEVGEKWGYTYAYFVMPANNVTLRFEAYHWDGSKWVSDGYREVTVYLLSTPTKIVDFAVSPLTITQKQSAKFTGKLMDSVLNKGIPNMYIEITYNDTKVAGDYTKSDGSFEIYWNPTIYTSPGKYNMYAKFRGA
jgi:hypothetical protein